MWHRDSHKEIKPMKTEGRKNSNIKRQINAIELKEKSRGINQIQQKVCIFERRKY